MNDTYEQDDAFTPSDPAVVVAAERHDEESLGGQEHERPDPEAVAEVAGDFLEGLLEVLGLPGEVTMQTEGDSVLVDVSGDGMGLLIGRRGQTLEALQEITRTAVQRRVRARVRLIVDVEGYRARRRESLAQYARAMAERAKSRQTEIELEAMSAFDRKIVHDAIAAIEGATSFSEGTEPNRKVIVAPA